jgi:hypothetical protein
VRLDTFGSAFGVRCTTDERMSVMNLRRCSAMPAVNWLALASLLVGGLHLLSPAARACTVPVFRYALERWPADPYDLLIFHGGPLSDEESARVNAIRERALDERSPGNLQVRLVDLETTLPAAARKFWDKHQGDTLPWGVLLYPMRAESREVIWRGPITTSTAGLLLDSPKRREIARRILEGDSVVWVLLESGNKTRDEAAATTLATQLAEFEDMLELPFGLDEEEEEEGDFADVELIDPGVLNPSSMLSTLPLHIAFSMIRVTRDDPSERLLVDMLTRTEPDLVEYTSMPMAFAIFGRGRALPALVGRGINRNMIGGASQFLTGACSCEIKAFCPGTDLLMAVNWEGVLADWVSVDDAFPALTGVLPTPVNSENPGGPVAAQAVGSPTQLRERKEPGGGSAILLNTVIAIGVVLLVVVAATFVLKSAMARSGRKIV